MNARNHTCQYSILQLLLPQSSVCFLGGGGEGAHELGRPGRLPARSAASRRDRPAFGTWEVGFLSCVP